MRTPETFDWQGLRALIRVDYNVPLDESLHITDDTRIRATLPTLHAVLAGGGSVVLMSHLGRPKSGPEDKFSLKHLVPALEAMLQRPVRFASNCIGPEAESLCARMDPGTVVLLENLRFHPEEEAGDAAFAQQLAQWGDVYLNDAFGTAHRAHASTAVVAEYFPGRCGFGYVMSAEIENVSKVLESQEHPVVAIIGGAKVSSKISILENLLGRVDALLIGGGMAFTFLRAQGGHTGASLIEEEHIATAKSILEKARERGVAIHLPHDSLNANRFANEAERSVSEANAIPEGWMGLDIGPKTIAHYAQIVESSKVILWNGPLGVFEMPAFAGGTLAIGQAIVRATQAGAFSLVGGGDSVAAAKQFGLESGVSYVSTGGGAMLEYLEGRGLPGIDAVLAHSGTAS
ncbi:phosphoglycerate kinase [bacterium]|nr:phosphoglycerate kinase [bacterium]